MRFRIALPLLAAATVAAISACSGQGEGGLCNPKAGNSGNDDCGSGLTCQPRPAIVVNGFGICCPPGGQSTTTACSVSGTTTDASPAPVTPEASTAVPIESSTETGATDATVDGATEVGPGTDATDAGTE